MLMLSIVGVKGLAIVDRGNSPCIPLTLGSKISRGRPAQLSMMNNQDREDEKRTQVTTVVEVYSLQGIGAMVGSDRLHNRIFGINIAQLQLGSTQVAVVQCETLTIGGGKLSIPSTSQEA